MPATIKPWAQETTTTQGTGTIRLSGTTPSDACRFRALYADADQVAYVVSNGEDHEKIRGTISYGTGPGGEDELSIDIVLETLVAGVADRDSPSAIDWGPGTRDVYVAYDRSNQAVAAENLADLYNPSEARSNLGLGTMALETATAYVLLAGATMTGPITLAGNPSGSLDAAPKQYADAAGVSANLEFASGDEFLWGGSSVPSGFTVKTGTAYDDRVPIIVTDAASTRSTGGSWGGSVNVSINGHTLTLSEIPSHSHDGAVRYTRMPKYTYPGFLTLVDDITAATGGSQAYTSASSGGGGSHSHTASGSISSGWRPKNRTLATIARS